LNLNYVLVVRCCDGGVKGVVGGGRGN